MSSFFGVLLLVFIILLVNMVADTRYNLCPFIFHPCLKIFLPSLEIWWVCVRIAYNSLLYYVYNIIVHILYTLNCIYITNDTLTKRKRYYVNLFIFFMSLIFIITLSIYLTTSHITFCLRFSLFLLLICTNFGRNTKYSSSM